MSCINIKATAEKRHELSSGTICQRLMDGVVMSRNVKQETKLTLWISTPPSVSTQSGPIVREEGFDIGAEALTCTTGTDGDGICLS